MLISWVDVGIFAGISALFITCLLLAFPEKQTVDACFLGRKTVVAIGGCDRSAVCAVAFSDGSRGKTIYPLVGDVVYPPYKNDDRYFKNCN